MTAATRILIVDDSDFARTGLKVLLAGREDCEVCGEANDGRQAVMKAIDLNPDLIILDYSMPGMDGLHVAQEIYKALPEALILICTLFPSRELEREAMKYGVRHVISKAEMSKALVNVIESIRPDSRTVS
jgi:two-component system, chemotaxis family, chemotaxis protein CheY